MLKKVSVLVSLLLLTGCAAGPYRLHEPITLRPGETKQVGPDGFEITLRSLSEDSGCFSPSDCSLMIFKGTIAVRRGDKKDLIQVGASLKPGQVVPLDGGGYLFQLTGVKPVGRDLEATSTILGPKQNGSTSP